jgi:Family of unknown function (DUF5681)
MEIVGRTIIAIFFIDNPRFLRYTKSRSYREDKLATGTKGDYEVGYGKPPRDAGFKKGQSGNPRGRPPGSKNLTTLLNDALNQRVTITEDGRQRKITKREAVMKQLVNKSASADPRSLKMLLDLMLNLEARARTAGAPTPAAGPADEEVLAQLKARLEGVIRDQIASGT